MKETWSPNRVPDLDPFAKTHIPGQLVKLICELNGSTIMLSSLCWLLDWCFVGKYIFCRKYILTYLKVRRHQGSKTVLQSLNPFKGKNVRILKQAIFQDWLCYDLAVPISSFLFFFYYFFID